MFALLLSVALAFTPEDAHRAHDIASRFVEQCTPREAGTIRGRIASNFILDEASKLGADVRRDLFYAKTPEGERQLANLYAEFTTDVSKPWIVLTSHYDTKPGTDCPGANDGASTTALLISLINVLFDWKTPKGNVLLVWTDGEECFRQYGDDDGLWGSRRAAKYVQDRGIAVRAVVNLDMLGDEDLKISIPANGTEKLAKIAIHAARRAGYPGLVTRMDEHVKDDHEPFLNAGFNAIDLIDFEYGKGNAYWHTSDDTMKHVSEASMLKSGSLVVELLNILL